MSELSLKTLSIEERQDELRRLVEQRTRITVGEICEQFAVSEATARRDLDTLAERGEVLRVHGGAIAVRRAPPEPPALQRSVEQASNKQRIGQLAASLIGDGETIFLGSGTTVYEVACNLIGRRDLTVITNSLLVINALSDAPGITVISLGGMLRRSELSFIGHITEDALSQLRADTVIMGIRALDPVEGLTNDYLPETRTDRALLNIGKQVIIVADHTKIGRVSTAFVAPLSMVNILVTDEDTPPELLQAFSARGVQLLVI
jgi:DeoR family transcriptional regulator, aga operon transcriptional repressor